MRKVEWPSLAREIDRSCRQGDHLDVDKRSVRAVLGFLLVFLGVFRRPQSIKTNAPVLLIVANCVAHGRRLAEALERSIPPNLPFHVLRDERLSTLATTRGLNAPGLAPRSVWRLASVTRLAFYLRLRLYIGRRLHPYTSSPYYNEYIFLAQVLRFSAARASVSSDTRLIVTDFDRSAYSWPWVWAGARLGVPVITAVHGTPNERSYLPVLSETVLAWGSVQEAWFKSRCPGVRIEVVGRPDLHSRVAAPRHVARVIICHSREDLTHFETRQLIDLAIQARAAGLYCVVRLHPSSSTTIGRGWRDVAAHCRVEPPNHTPLSVSLQPGDLVVGVLTTALVESLISGHLVLAVVDPTRLLPPDVAAIGELATLFGFERTQHPRVRSEYADALSSIAGSLVDATGDASQERIRTILQRLAR